MNLQRRNRRGGRRSREKQQTSHILIDTGVTVNEGHIINENKHNIMGMDAETDLQGGKELKIILDNS